MSRPYHTEESESIDQVIQSGHGLSSLEQDLCGSEPIVGVKRMNAPPPTPPSPAWSSRSRPLSPRQDQIPTPLRSTPAASSIGRSGTFSDLGKRDNGSWMKGSLRGDTHISKSINGEPSAGLAHAGRTTMNITDFFSAEVFQVVIRNPTTAHRFLKFCQSRACGENLEFLQKVDAYHRALDEITRILSSIQSTYISIDAPRQINLAHSYVRRLSVDIKHATSVALPGMESIFAGAQDQVEQLVVSDIYPRFVKHQVTAAATIALADHRESFQGLGDCFCLTDPLRADNPILFASDGFVAVTGYTRRDFIPRNCRFLQGELTDSRARKRLRYAVDNYEETVELLLNYRKNGDPFWNLLYVSPLLNERGEVVFFLGGQIDCSTTIHSRTDILKVLSINDDELDLGDLSKKEQLSVKNQESRSNMKSHSNFFKSVRKYSSKGVAASKIRVRDEAGMESELIDKLGKLSFKTQVEAFYTAYSKYLVLNYIPQTQNLIVQHYSPGVIDLLGLNLPNGTTASIFNRDIFRILTERSLSSSSIAKTFKTTVRDAMKRGKAVSVETRLLTGYEERRERSGLGKMMGDKGDGGTSHLRLEVKYVTHWTPLKDEEGRTSWVVLTIAPKG